MQLLAGLIRPGALALFAALPILATRCHIDLSSPLSDRPDPTHRRNEPKRRAIPVSAVAISLGR
jgi:hypothetical protein